MKRIILLATVALVMAAMMVAMAAPAAFAAHDHYLVTPGNCVEDIASGQTSQTSGGGAHKFHDNVHLGTPGMFALGTVGVEGKAPVDVYKAGTGPGCSS